MPICAPAIVSMIVASCYCYLIPSADCVAKLVMTIDLNPSVLHRDVTPSTVALIRIGTPAIGPVLDLMLANKRDTRMRAQAVLENITMHKFGRIDGEGWPTELHYTRWQQYWKELGDLNFDDTLEKRRASVKKWKKTMKDQRKIGVP